MKTNETIVLSQKKTKPITRQIKGKQETHDKNSLFTEIISF